MRTHREHAGKKMPNLRERTPVITIENGLVRIRWRATGCDGASVIETGEQEALTPYVAMCVAHLLIEAVEEFQGHSDGRVLDIRTG